MGTTGGVSALRPQQQPGTSLRSLLDSLPVGSGAPEVSGDADVVVRGVASDSRLVAPGDLYLALPGRQTHGAGHVRTALASGAVAVLTDQQGRAMIQQQQIEQQNGQDEGSGAAGMPVVVLADPRAVMAELAAELYGRPATRMAMLGVTGTNGKTTTAYLIDAGLRAAGRHAGLIGTLGFSFDGRPLTGARTTVTTPESAELQGLLAALAERGAEMTAMEVSSHALTLGRVDAIVFDVAGFTNFGRDHLDFHGSEQAYFAAKASLFTRARTRQAVIDVDDPRGPGLVRQARDEGLAVHTTGRRNAADYRATDVSSGPDGSVVSVTTPDGPLEFTLALPGAYNVSNALTALAMLAAVGVDPAAASAGFAAVAVPGRMQRVALGSGAPRVYVDFAHTPQAVESALAALRPVAGSGRLVCVLGCGGDRDRAKRAPMGAAAVRGVRSGSVIVTDDNPRSEDPVAIREAVLAGASAALTGADPGAGPGTGLEAGPGVDLADGGDRRSAIRAALAAAVATGRPDQVVVAVLGKGHEQGQEVDGRLQPFDDVAVVGEEWAGLGRGAGR